MGGGQRNAGLDPARRAGVGQHGLLGSGATRLTPDDPLPAARNLPSTQAEPYDVETHVADAVRVLAFHLAVAHSDRVLGVVAIDALGAVPDGGWEDLDSNLVERLARDSPEAAARAKEIDERAMAAEGSDAEVLESLELVWPFYFSNPGDAPPLPETRISVPLYAAVVDSVHEHFERGTLERSI